jgi:hypothetical protein
VISLAEQLGAKENGLQLRFSLLRLGKSIVKLWMDDEPLLRIIYYKSGEKFAGWEQFDERKDLVVAVGSDVFTHRICFVGGFNRGAILATGKQGCKKATPPWSDGQGVISPAWSVSGNGIR